MNTEPEPETLTANDIQCRHRGRPRCDNADLFACNVHGTCSIQKLHLRIRSCVACSDRTEQRERPPESNALLGSVIESALSGVGITKERVTDWLGVPCNCEEHRDKLNQLHLWAMRYTRGKLDQAKESLEAMFSGHR